MYICKERRGKNYEWELIGKGLITDKIEDLCKQYNQLKIGERLRVPAFGNNRDLIILMYYNTIEVYEYGSTYIGYIDIEKVYEDLYEFLEALNNYNLELLEKEVTINQTEME